MSSYVESEAVCNVSHKKVRIIHMEHFTNVVFYVQSSRNIGSLCTGSTVTKNCKCCFFIHIYALQAGLNLVCFPYPRLSSTFTVDHLNDVSASAFPPPPIVKLWECLSNTFYYGIFVSFPSPLHIALEGTTGSFLCGMRNIWIEFLHIFWIHLEKDMSWKGKKRLSTVENVCFLEILRSYPTCFSREYSCDVSIRLETTYQWLLNKIPVLPEGRVYP